MALVYLAMITFMVLLGGCGDSERNTVILTQGTCLSADQHDAINSNYGFIVEMQNDIADKYQIRASTRKYVLQDTVRLGNTLPVFDHFLRVTGARINLNYALFVSSPDQANNRAAIKGLIAHELAHAQHFLCFSGLELLQLGLRYSAYERAHSRSKWALWVRSYERFTDLQVVAYGFADELVSQKQKTLEYLQQHPDEDALYEFTAYLTRAEILAVRDNLSAFDKMLHEILDLLEWPVFREIAARFPSCN
ncbi:hypothetical protein [Spongorhabdus nitratireducens]